MNYFADLVDKTICVGNTLSTINLDLSSLDLALFELSSYSTNSITFLSANADALETSILTVSANAPSFSRTPLFPNSAGQIKYDFDIHGSNVRAEISANVSFDNISALNSGEWGKILLKISPTTAVSITSWGNQWSFSNTSSTFNYSASAQNLINFYKDENRILAQVFTF
jgi:hypothetical protein